jgi:hypothetical protein
VLRNGLFRWNLFSQAHALVDARAVGRIGLGEVGDLAAQDRLRYASADFPPLIEAASTEQTASTTDKKSDPSLDTVKTQGHIPWPSSAMEPMSCLMILFYSSMTI